MLTIGKTDAFEHDYMTRFEKLAGRYGIFVKYERDRAARDIGLHLTKEMRSGSKLVTNSLVWFQMKGVMSTTLSKEVFDQNKEVRLSMEVPHLRHWYLDNEPTQLVVYVESANQFLVMNLQKYVRERWGRDIMTLNQATATVTVPDSSVLDEQAFSLLLRHAEIAQWTKALDANRADIELVSRDFELIYSAGVAARDGSELGMRWKRWISKARDELEISLRPADVEGKDGDDWKAIHMHWEFGGIDLEERYPYLELYGLEGSEPKTFTNRWGEAELPDDGETITFHNGDIVFSPNFANEFLEFVFGARLNGDGQRLFSYVQQLLEMGLLEVNNAEDGRGTFVSIAHWHNRLV